MYFPSFAGGKCLDKRAEEDTRESAVSAIDPCHRNHEEHGILRRESMILAALSKRDNRFRLPEEAMYLSLLFPNQESRPFKALDFPPPRSSEWPVSPPECVADGSTVSPSETETKKPNGTIQTQGTKNAMIWGTRNLYSSRK
jgi:hypothetical protein